MKSNITIKITRSCLALRQVEWSKDLHNFNAYQDKTFSSNSKSLLIFVMGTVLNCIH